MKRVRVTLFDESVTLFGELVNSESVSVEWWATILAHVIHSHYIFILQHHFLLDDFTRERFEEKNPIFEKNFSVKFLDSESYVFRIANRSK